MPDTATMAAGDLESFDGRLRILVLGGDGFCGWPTALYLSKRGHQIGIIDDLSRRAIAEELGAESLTPIAPIEKRISTWRELTGQQIFFECKDISASRIQEALVGFAPDVIIHFAEQRAAPYSMKSGDHKRYTVQRNIATTHNLLSAIVETGIDTHVIHLGSMGVYGYGAVPGKIPEGYLDVQVIRNDEPYAMQILHPTRPGSIYHMTKCMDQLMFEFYARNDGLRITDLHQGIVWGTNTDETTLHPALINRFDYDGDYGTVLNRFLVQAAIGYPMTVHGSGGQTRAFIHIRDTVECIRLAVENPPPRDGRVRILNQMTECHRLIDLAELISTMFGGAAISHTPNPRNEAAENDLLVANDLLLKMGLKPRKLGKDLITEIVQVVYKYQDRIDRSAIPCTSTWTRSHQPGMP